MRLQPASFRDIQTPTGRMRTHWFAPDCDRAVPAVMLYSEIYQMTGPIARTAAMLAGHGYLVAVPEVYHEYADPGEAFAYDADGTERGNRLKITKPVSAFDDDSNSLVETLMTDDQCSGEIASLGICLGGHLAFRAAMNPRVAAGICLYATDIHKRSLGAGMSDDTLDRISELRAEMLMIWGRQDPHIPSEGRRLIYEAMESATVPFTWHEFNGEHAFLRDEGHRYDPAHAHLVYTMMLHHLRRTVG
ncbi:MAG: dienelactone hydrolase family protein [Planctomycetota bacterium]